MSRPKIESPCENVQEVRLLASLYLFHNVSSDALRRDANHPVATKITDTYIETVGRFYLRDTVIHYISTQRKKGNWVRLGDWAGVSRILFLG